MHLSFIFIIFAIPKIGVLEFAQAEIIPIEPVQVMLKRDLADEF
jgi:hypothetical protein